MVGTATDGCCTQDVPLVNKHSSAATKLISKGFLPIEDPYLMHKQLGGVITEVENLLNAVEKKASAKFQLPLGQSQACYPWLAPDPTGLLDGDTCVLIRNGVPVVGELVLVRNPSYQSRHVVKMRGVEPPVGMLGLYQRNALATSKYDQIPTDVLLLPSNSSVLRSWADMLCGGDHDGDRVVAIFDPSITHCITENPKVQQATPSLTSNDEKCGSECVTSSMGEQQVQHQSHCYLLKHCYR